MAVGFSRLAVRGYRRLKNVDLQLRPFNVLIGANGVGKSSILDIFNLLAASAAGSLQNAVTESGGMTALVTADGKTDGISLELKQDKIGGQPFEYQLDLSLQSYGYFITREILAQWGVPFGQEVFNSIYIDSSRDGSDNAFAIVFRENESPIETSLSRVFDMHPEMADFHHLLADVSPIYHGLDITRRAPVRMPQTLARAEVPGIDGEDLLSCLYTMRETDRDRFDAVEDALHAAFPTFERLEFPPLTGGLLALGWRERGFSRAIAANELSEGTLRFLWLVTLLQSPGLPKITLIDEPEVSMHPEMLRLLADLMREATERTQLIVATHSDRFVRFLDSSELILCDRDEDGFMTTRWASDLELEDWMENYTLDQLWNMGRLEGRP